ncbi:MAG: mechanosensitive ion channel family protein [Phycisphaerales bacterium JB040]
MLTFIQDGASEATEEAAENLEQAAEQTSEAAGELAGAADGASGGATGGAESGGAAFPGSLEDAADPQIWIDLFNTYGIPVLKALILLVVTLIVAGWARGFVTKVSEKARVEKTLAKFFGNIAKYAVLALGIITILGAFGVETASFAAVLASVGFAIGLALSGTVNNIAAGVMLLIFRPFKVGDVITTNSITAKVDEIGLFTTSLDTFDNRRFIVPNGEIANSVIENISHHSTRRADVSVGIEYSADIDTARRVLEKVLAETEGVLQDPAPVVYLTELGDSSVNFVLRSWCAAPDFWAVKERVTRGAKYALDNADIGIPFPQRDIHVPGGITVKVLNG